MSYQNKSISVKRIQQVQIILLIVVVIISAAPALVFYYLPMTDLPQHFANLSILCNFDDPSYGFSQFYERDFTKTLYILPYLMAWALTSVMPIEMALRSVVFLSLIVYPLGVLVCLRSQGKPLLLTLLAVPLIYNLATFWGFVNFNLAVGVALFAFYLFSKEQPTWRSEVVLTVLCLALTTIHLYGTALIVGYAILWSVFGKEKNTIRRYLPLAPCVIGIVIWTLMWRQGRAVGQENWIPIDLKITKMEDALLGGYQDWSETWIFSVFCIISTLFILYHLSIPKSDRIRIFPKNTVLFVYFILNILAYFILPLDVLTAKIIFPRHIIIAFCFVPLIVPVDFLKKLPKLGSALLLFLALVSIGNAWIHFYYFDIEARSFDQIIERTPRGQRIIQSTLERNGQIMQTAPYLHFLTYIQGKKGGFIATGFAQYAWLAPIRVRRDLRIPATPDFYEWEPQLYDYDSFGRYYNYLVTRGYHPEATATINSLPYELVYEIPPWRLFRTIRRSP